MSFQGREGYVYVGDSIGIPLPSSADPHDFENCTPAPTETEPVNPPFPTPSLEPETPRPDGVLSSPGAAAQGVRSGAELLRRLSLMDQPMPQFGSPDPRDYPDLRLSGRIISAAFCLPYKLSFQPQGPWTLNHRTGTSALFDSFAYLGSPHTPWSHTLVGWTGEVEELPAPIQTSQTDAWGGTAGHKMPTIPLNKATAPVPVDPFQKPSHPTPDRVVVTRQDRDSLEGQLLTSKFGKILPVWLCEEPESPADDLILRDQARWRRYADRLIYPTFHYKPSGLNDARAESQWWLDYVRLNQLFADRIIETYTPGDIVWIHDYQLFLLPSLLRQRIPGIYIGFFLHTPFPSSEFLRCLSKRKDILTGVLGSNMIGFQSFTYSRHFSSCCTRILRFASNSAGIDAYGAHVAVDAFPTGIDANAVRKLAFGRPDIEKTITEIRKIYGNKKIIVGRDRLDSVRGVTQKLMAFESFLDRYPEWRERVVLIQVTSPTNVEEAKEESEARLSTQISHLVSTINGRYGSISFSPVQHYPQYLSQDEYFALLRTADIGLITSVRDGMNTTSLEYVVCQQGHHGPLIISEFSGTAGSLRDAIHINPWDITGVADAINQALKMTEEEKARQHTNLYNHVITNTIMKWSDQYLKRLLTNLASFNQTITTPALDIPLMLSRYLSARQRLFMFDYDGTLTPIVKDPQAAIPSDRVLRTIKTLAADPKNSVWIISGRDQNFLEEWMGHISELGLSAEHGSFVRKPGEEVWENLAEKSGLEWQDEAVKVFQAYSDRTQGSFIERKRVAVTWHYRRVDPEYGAYQAKECKRHLENTVAKKYDLEVMAGKANLEIRPTFVNKGAIATRLVNDLKRETGHDPDFVLCMGDDFTDEDMFCALRASNLPRDNVFSVTIGAGSKQTLAYWHLLEPSDVIAAIATLNNKKLVAEDRSGS